MKEDLQLGQQIDAQLKLSTSLEPEGEGKLIKGEKISTQLYVELTNKSRGGRLWPVLLSSIKEKMNIMSYPSGRSLVVKLGKWSDSVSQISGGGVSMNTGDYVDSTFNCPWNELKDQRAKVVFDREVVSTGNGFWTIQAGQNVIDTNVVLGDCRPNDWENKKTAECDLKLSTGKSQCFQEIKRLFISQKWWTENNWKSDL